jgi:EAL domain-containing protein (putative c-di-GMP-specific phosphodiesterase class I)
LQDGQFSLVYQPVCHLVSGEITSVEALLRWNHPTQGQIQPGDFIPLLEESGLILEVGRWVLMQACHQAARWQREGRVLDMAVNVSGRQLLTDRLLTDVQDSLSASGLDPERLVLEITESTMMVDVQATAARLKAVRALGVRIALDDFGTGYSSLAVLRDFPADFLKIDRSFIAALTDADDSTALIQTFVQLGNTLGLDIIAEGIETADQYRKLQSHGCHSGQGFLISRPMPAPELEAGPLLSAARFQLAESAPRAI